MLIADDHPIMRDALQDWLGEESDLEVVGAVGDGVDAQRLAQRLQPDILLLDVDMPGAGGVEVAQAVRAAQLATRIVVLTGYGGGYQAEALKRVGVDAYLSKAASLSQVVAVIRLVHAGHTCVLAGRGDHARLQLTARELDVLKLVIGGLQNRPIAEQLCITERTVEFHVTNLLRKFGASCRAELVRLAGRACSTP